MRAERNIVAAPRVKRPRDLDALALLVTAGQTDMCKRTGERDADFVRRIVSAYLDAATIEGKTMIESGAVVCLKSGGPPMTVRVVTGELGLRPIEGEGEGPQVAVCDWTDANGAPYQRPFRLEQLEECLQPLTLAERD